MRSGANRFGLGINCSFVCITLADDARAQAVSGLSAIRVASGLSSPLFSTAPPGDFNRLFIVQQNGVIRNLNLNTGVLNATPFLTVGRTVSGGEQGLLGLAFDPNYATNGEFYVKCTAPGGAFNAGIDSCSSECNSGASAKIVAPQDLALHKDCDEAKIVGREFCARCPDGLSNQSDPASGVVSCTRP